jgi:hypothetical protein
LTVATTTSLTFAIFGRYHGSAAFRQARRDLDTNEQAMRRANKQAASLAKGFNLLWTSAISLLPALVPIAAQLTAVGAGFLAASAAAGAAAGIWGFALKGAITEAGKWQKQQNLANKEVDKARTALAKAKPGTQAYAAAQVRLNQALKAQRDLGKTMPKVYKDWNSSVGRLSNGWQTFIRRMAPSTLRPAITVVNALTGSIKKLEPVVKAVSPVAQEVANSFANWTKNGGLDRAISLIVQYGVPALREFVKMGRNVISVLGTGFRAFLPTGMQVVKTIERGSLALKHWADGGGFQRFLAYVKSNSGMLGQFWKALLQALVRVAKAMKDVAPLSLLIATALLKIVAAMPPQFITIMVQAFVAWKAAMIGLMVINLVRRAIIGFRIALTVLRLTMLAFPGAWIVIAIGLVITAVVLIATKTTWFQTAWKATWAAVKVAANAVWSFLGGKFKWLILIIGPVGWLLLLLRNWRAVWNGIRNATWAVWSFIHGKVFQPIVKFFTQIIPNAARTVARSVTSWWNAMWRGIRAAYQSINRNVFGPIGRFFTRTIPGWAHSMRTTVVHAFGLMASGIKGQWNKLESIAKKPVKFFVNTVYNNGLRKAWNNTAGRIPGVPNLPHASLPFNSGGPVRGMGTGTSDSINARLSHGEFVVRAKAVRQIGVPALNRLNSMGGSQVAGGRSDYQPGFALGGLIPNPIDVLKKAGGAAFGAVKWGADVIQSVGGKALNIMFGPIKSLIKRCTSNFRESGMIGKAVQNNALRAIPIMLKYAISKMSIGGGERVMKALAWAKTQQGKPYQWGGNGNPSWDCSGFMSAIESVIRGQSPHRRWATGSFPPGAPGWKRNLKSPFTIGITNAGVGHTAGTLAGVNVECRGGKGCIVGAGARGANDGMFTSRWGFEGAMGGAAGGNAQAIAKSMLGQFGWGMQYWPALNSLWQRESGWNPLAKNPSSGAYGIPQALPGSKMASAGSDWRTNPATQIKWGLGYIRSVYGNPNVAWSKWQSRSPHWYAGGGAVQPMVFDEGGYLPKGVSLVNNKTGHPEPLKRLGRNHGSGCDDGVSVKFEDCVFAGSAKEFENMVVKAVNEAKRKKRL